MNTEVPERPRYYILRAYGPFLGIIIFFIVLQFLESILAEALFGVFFCLIIYLVRHKINPREISEYHQYLISKNKKSARVTVSDEVVRENIARYREEQRVKKENAKWWQFWYW